MLWRQGPGQGVGGAVLPPEVTGGSLLWLPQLLVASGTLWLVAASLQTLPLSSGHVPFHVCVTSLSVFLLWGGLWSDCPGPPGYSRIISACQDPYHVCKDPCSLSDNRYQGFGPGIFRWPLASLLCVLEALGNVCSSTGLSPIRSTCTLAQAFPLDWASQGHGLYLINNWSSFPHPALNPERPAQFHNWWSGHIDRLGKWMKIQEVEFVTAMCYWELIILGKIKKNIYLTVLGLRCSTQDL